MIHFFKPKPFLRDFIPDGYVDIHSHLLPGIDDGSPNIKTTAKLIDGLQDLGISKFITTPHIMSDVWNNSAAGILETERKTLSDLNLQGLQNKFKTAAEYMMDATFRELFTIFPKK